MVLDRVLQSKREEVEARRARVPLQELRALVRDLNPPLDFRKAISREGRAVKVIAEVKKASPSSGILREDFSPADLARSYARAGAAAISVLTDGPFFQGSLLHLQEVRSAVALPLLRKDFVIDPYQIYEARAFSADAVLLIAAVLEFDRLREYLDLASVLQLHSLVEVHDDEELFRAIEAGAPTIGINNRDLRTFQVSLDVTFSLLRLIPDGKVVVSESGIASRAEVRRLAEAGVDAILVGEALLRALDVEAKLRELLL